jgi:HEAT repeat protein
LGSLMKLPGEIGLANAHENNPKGRIGRLAQARGTTASWLARAHLVYLRHVVPLLGARPQDALIDSMLIAANGDPANFRHRVWSHKQSLGLQEQELFRDRLVEKLSDKNPAIRLLILSALQHYMHDLTHRKETKLLARVIIARNDPDPSVKREAWSLLGNFFLTLIPNPEPLVEEMLQIVRTSPDEELGAHLLEILKVNVFSGRGRYRDKPIIERDAWFLLGKIRDPRAKVRAKAIGALGVLLRVHGLRIGENLKELCTRRIFARSIDTSEGVRLAVLEALPLDQEWAFRHALDRMG